MVPRLPDNTTEAADWRAAAHIVRLTSSGSLMTSLIAAQRGQRSHNDQRVRIRLLISLFFQPHSGVNEMRFELLNPFQRGNPIMPREEKHPLSISEMLHFMFTFYSNVAASENLSAAFGLV